MTEPQTEVRELPPALAEPTVHVRGMWVTGLSVASLGMWMASLTAIQFLLLTQLQHIDKAHKFLAVGLVSALGAVAAVVATPVAGALSDRTTHAYGVGRLRGRRHRWTLSMALLAAICMVVLAHMNTVIGVAIMWMLFSAFQNGEYASLSAAIPDHVPVRQRATVAGWVGMPQALGLVLGAFLVSDIFTKLIPGYYALAGLMLLLAIPFVLWSEDHPLPPEYRQPLSWRQLVTSCWVSPRKYPDFAWAWLTRFLASLAIAMGTLYLLYFLEDQIHYRKLFHHSAYQGLTLVIVIYAACVIITAIVGGMISDRIGKRKMIVTISGALMGCAAVLLIFVETWDSLLLAAVLYGVGFGAYLAVDQALITQVLPAAADRAKDLGVINIAIVGPAVIGSAVAAPLVTLGSYPTLFAATAVVAALGSIFVWKIKSVA